MSLDDFLDRLNREPRYAPCIAAWRTIPAQEAVTAPMPEALDPRLTRAMAQRGVTQLYSHQADAFDAIEKGRHTVVVTPTASGKTLCYNLPVLNTLLADPTARAMYLFQTTALPQAQSPGLQAITDAARGPPSDGYALLSTPAAARTRTRPRGTHSRRGLLRLVGRRKRMLRYREATDIERYRSLIKRLGLRR